MRHMRFMVLTGHLDDYSLPGLIKMLHSQRKTGRLQVDYAESPAAFYFEEGKLVDAKLGDLRGLEALYLALSLPGASFNFNPLIKPPERTVAEREQKFIQGLLEAPAGGSALEAPAISARGGTLIPVADTAAATALLPGTVGETTLPATVEERLLTEVGAALASHSKRFSRERAIYAGIIAVLLLITFVSRPHQNEAPATAAAPRDTPAAVTAPTAPTEVMQSTEILRESAPASGASSPVGGREAKESRARALALNPTETPSANGKERANKQLKMSSAETVPSLKDKSKAGRGAATAAAPGGQAVRVLMRVERGRVLQAVVQNSRPGMESFEALALRMARQRRYPKDFSGSDTLQLKVQP